MNQRTAEILPATYLVTPLQYVVALTQSAILGEVSYSNVS
jgi:hypothetical protein